MEENVRLQSTAVWWGHGEKERSEKEMIIRWIIWNIFNNKFTKINIIKNIYIGNKRLPKNQLSFSYYAFNLKKLIYFFYN
jgi:hypothetical protein